MKPEEFLKLVSDTTEAKLITFTARMDAMEQQLDEKDKRIAELESAPLPDPAGRTDEILGIVAAIENEIKSQVADVQQRQDGQSILLNDAAVSIEKYEGFFSDLQKEIEDGVIRLDLHVAANNQALGELEKGVDSALDRERLVTGEKLLDLRTEQSDRWVEKTREFLKEFLPLLRGEKGEKGDPGRDGQNGQNGEDGKEGTGILSAEVLPVDGDPFSSVLALELTNGITSTSLLEIPQPNFLSSVWSQTKAYKANDSIISDGHRWVARVNEPAGKPGVSEDWYMLSMRGPQGKRGEKG